MVIRASPSYQKFECDSLIQVAVVETDLCKDVGTTVLARLSRIC